MHLHVSLYMIYCICYIYVYICYVIFAASEEIALVGAYTVNVIYIYMYIIVYICICIHWQNNEAMLLCASCPQLIACNILGLDCKCHKNSARMVLAAWAFHNALECPKRFSLHLVLVGWRGNHSKRRRAGEHGHC